MKNHTKKQCPATALDIPNKAKQTYSNSSSSQRSRILKHFESSPRSTIQARRDYGILHPGERIMELRKKGHKIYTHWICEFDVRGVPHRVGLYIYQGQVRRDHGN